MTYPYDSSAAPLPGERPPFNGPCQRCNGTRKVVVRGVKNGRHYSKKVRCPDCTKESPYR